MSASRKSKAKRKKQYRQQSAGEICLCANCAAKYTPDEVESFTFGPLQLHKADSRRQKVIAIFNQTAERIRGLGYGVGRPEDNT